MCKLLMQNGLASSPSLELVTIALLFALALCRLDAHLLVVLLKRREVFAGLRKLALFHSFTEYQCTKARLEYIKSNLWSMREKTSAMAVLLLIMQQARITLARSPPGTTVGGW